MSGCNCAHARANLEELIRGELTAQDCGPIRAHLAECAECRDEQQVFEQLTAAVRRACDAAAPPSLRDAILTSLTDLHPAAASAEGTEPAASCGCGTECRCGSAVR